MNAMASGVKKKMQCLSLASIYSTPRQPCFFTTYAFHSSGYTSSTALLHMTRFHSKLKSQFPLKIK